MKKWKKTAGLPESTTRVPIYCDESHKEEWKEEAEEKGYNSMSKYLYELVQEARAYREEGFLSHHQSRKRIAELQEEVDELRDKLEKEKQTSTTEEIDEVDFLERFLTHQYQPLNSILEDIAESGVLDDIIRKPVEDQLFHLAQQDRVEYKRGHGWKLKQKEGGDE